jgi:hypothetical protein
MNVYNARVNVINLTPVSHQNHSPQTSRAMRIALGMIINIRSDLVYSHTQRTKCVEQMSLHITKAVLTSAQQRKKNVPAPNVKSQTTLISTGQTGERSRSVKDRKRNHRLNGADIYIARLGYRRDDASSPSVVCSGPGHDSPEDPPSPRCKIRSLHDELTYPRAQPKTPDVRVTQPEAKQVTALASRPCYRCISYMASVGIRRAFWTTEDGMWESAKVGDLMDSLNNMAPGKPTDIDTALNSVFVTKHEVLMLRRTMGSSQ